MMSHYPTVRMRRVRGNATLRDMLAEVTLEPRQLILPLFVRSGRGVCKPVEQLPGVAQWSVDRLPEVVEPAMELGVRAFLFFGHPSYRDDCGTSSADMEQPLQQALSSLRVCYPDALLIADTNLCVYTTHGHCGRLAPEGCADNDETLALLAKTALSQARAGAHMLSPSDTMDGHVAALRAALDAEGMTETGIMSCAAQMSSVFYEPFLGAAGNAPACGDRCRYQLPSSNPREIVRDALMDADEGADVLIVKPAGPCLDIIARLRPRTDLPLAGYVTSGEFMMLSAAAAFGSLDRKPGLLEYHLGLRRAGCDLVITYFAAELARILREG